MSPVVRGRKGEFAKLFDDFRKAGYVRVRIDGEVFDLDEEIKLEKNHKHTIEVVIDRLVMRRRDPFAPDRLDRNRPASVRRPAAGPGPAEK